MRTYPNIFCENGQSKFYSSQAMSSGAADEAAADSCDLSLIGELESETLPVFCFLGKK